MVEGPQFVTLITRPRCFGKTLNMSMAEQFFSVKYAGSGTLFENLNTWSQKCFRKLQGTYPVLSLSFANVKESYFKSAKEKICQLLVNLAGERGMEPAAGMWIFKVEECTWDDLKQIEDKSYDTSLIEKGISQARIRKYGVAFQGKTVLIGRS